MLLRILASLVLLISVLFWPFWVSIILAILAMIYFPLFWEIIVLFFLSDLLYGVKEVSWFGSVFISFIIAIFILLIIEIIKKKLKFY